MISAYFARNLGDDLFLKILFDRYPHIQWELLTANRNYNDIFKSYRNVKIIYSYRDVKIGKSRFNLFYKISELINGFRKYDALVIIGGSIFMQSPAWKMKWEERKYLLDRFKRMNKKTFILGANFGPFTDNVFLERYTELFSEFDDVCFRDQHSYRFFKDLKNVRVAPDVVFNLDTGFPETKEKNVGFSIIDIKEREGLKESYNRYNDKMEQIIRRYAEQGYNIKLFSFCENEGDLRVANQLSRKLKDVHNGNNIQVVNYEGKIKEFLEVFHSCQIIIGARFHSIILAVIYDQSVFPIIYNEKTLNALKDLSMEQNSIHLKEIHNMDVIDIVQIAADNRNQDRHVFNEASRQFEKLDTILR
ncbi:hypothetical protein BEP19_13225 [Ammoniphilus oxalaticus]|uniref:Polysaccharide pyruvyl transferase domain-containing protein n=1 Tax=Ammoniphilus oxalaticus TaxID=66863 RepID=A0A419SHC7_9BACL|nr:polysaccharide pyruvyl transferase family protein [Ammoniphilus oxalaticus]RKD23173.1 hypothetical protein BEP19_13225 [Ammoniphilus oxalaticus]